LKPAPTKFEFLFAFQPINLGLIRPLADFAAIPPRTFVYTLKAFIQDLDQITQRYSDAAKIIAVAQPLLAELVRDPNCIEAKFKRHGGKTYGRYMLHRAPLFNVTTVVWGPGDGAKAHNHDTWGLVGVVENELQETRFERFDDGKKEGYAELAVIGVKQNKAGMVSTLLAPANDIHEMLNVTQRNTVEVHVYGKDLANMQRLQFDVEKKTVRYFASPKYDNC
jgi:predicted metal-dependent enzyme (double-stranded beta helix superfamily)